MNINKNEFNLVDIIKFTLIGSICSLALGLLLYYATQFTIYQYSLNANPGLTVLAFPLAVIISVAILAIYMDTIDAIVMGLIVAVLTALLQSPIIFMFMGYMKGNWFDIYIGNQIFLLVISGMFAAYFGNAYLKQRIH